MPADIDRAQLAALLDTIVPPSDGVPGGGDPVFVDRVLVDASEGYLRAALEGVMRELEAGFATYTPEERESAFATLEAADQAGAAAVVNLAYTAYYSDPRVLRALETSLGYRAVPPQPQGYDLPLFPVESIRREDRERQPTWRTQ